MRASTFSAGASSATTSEAPTLRYVRLRLSGQEGVGRRHGHGADTLSTEHEPVPLDVLLPRLNRMLLGWTKYFKYGCSHATFSYLRSYLWKQVIRWQERKHRRTVWKELRRRYGRGPPTGAWNCSTRQGYARNVTTTGERRSRSRGRVQHEMNHDTHRGRWRARCAERRTPGSGGDTGKPTGSDTGRAPRVDLTMTTSPALAGSGPPERRPAALPGRPAAVASAVPPSRRGPVT